MQFSRLDLKIRALRKSVYKMYPLLMFRYSFFAKNHVYYIHDEDFEQSRPKREKKSVLVVFQNLTKSKLKLKMGLGRTRAVFAFTTRRGYADTRRWHPANFILRHVDCDSNNDPARVKFTAPRRLRFSVTNRRVFHVFILQQNVIQYDLTRRM